ncbi:Protein of unknown function [Bacillus mycoides]|nr:Protein of unknown function [Bacillus mycoides]
MEEDAVGCLLND